MSFNFLKTKKSFDFTAPKKTFLESKRTSLSKSPLIPQTQNHDSPYINFKSVRETTMFRYQDISKNNVSNNQSQNQRALTSADQSMSPIKYIQILDKISQMGKKHQKGQNSLHMLEPLNTDLKNKKPCSQTKKKVSPQKYRIPNENKIQVGFIDLEQFITNKLKKRQEKKKQL